MAVENKELQTLLKINYRMLSLENLAVGYRKNKKALKLCLKLIKIENKDLKNHASVSPYELHEIQRRYDDFTAIVKRLSKASNEGAINREVADLHKIIEKTQNDILEIKQKLDPLSENVRKITATIGDTAQKVSKKIESGAQMIGNAIYDTVEGIKQKLSGSDTEE